METKYYCPICGHEFVQGEMNYNYETGKLDFVCPECEWEGNENKVSDHPVDMMIYEGVYDEDELEKKGLMVVCWPESQNLFLMDNFRDHTYLIDDEEGLDLFGDAAYVVESDWYMNAATN